LKRTRGSGVSAHFFQVLKPPIKGTSRRLKPPLRFLKLGLVFLECRPGSVQVDGGMFEARTRAAFANPDPYRKAKTKNAGYGG
jgi:hypothetical protein